MTVQEFTAILEFEKKKEGTFRTKESKMMVEALEYINDNATPEQLKKITPSDIVLAAGPKNWKGLVDEMLG